MSVAGFSLRCPGDRHLRRVALAPLVVAVAAAVARLVPVLLGSGLTGVIGYDDGVYYSASALLLDGRVPYRDFLLLHPPVVTIVLLPFVALGRWLGDPVGLAAGRLAFVAIGTVSALMVWWLARRVSALAGLAAGLVYALLQPVTDAEGSTLLEPLVNVSVLGSMVLLGDRASSRRRVLLAGGVLGLGVATKAWAVIPLLVLAGWLWRSRGLRTAMVYVASAAATATVACLPFVLLAGSRMVRLVVLDQLGRPDNGVTTASRLASMLGLQVAPGPVHGTLLVATLAATLLVTTAAAWLAWRRPVARMWCVLLAAEATMLLTSPSFFGHYGSFTGPGLALTCGVLVDALVGATRSRQHRLSGLTRPALMAAGALGLLVMSAHVVLEPEGTTGPDQSRVAAAVAASRCVAADSAIALVAADVLSRDLRRDCPVVVDLTGYTYDQDRGDLRAGPTPRARRLDREWQARATAYLGGADGLLLIRARADGLGRRTLSVLRGNDRVVLPPPYEVLVRRVPPSG